MNATTLKGETATAPSEESSKNNIFQKALEALLNGVMPEGFKVLSAARKNRHGWEYGQRFWVVDSPEGRFVAQCFTDTAHEICEDDLENYLEISRRELELLEKAKRLARENPARWYISAAAPKGEIEIKTHLPFGAMALLERFTASGVAGNDIAEAARHILISALTSKEYSWLRERDQ